MSRFFLLDPVFSLFYTLSIKKKILIEFLSNSIVKIMGAGEYVVELPGDSGARHFGLVVKDYAHSTAPNRRYPDLIKQLLLKEAMVGCLLHYENDELEALAKH